MTSNQSHQQDAIWDHFQNDATEQFSGSLPRLRWISRKVHKREAVLNIGIGDGSFEREASGRGACVHSLDPSARAVESLRSRFPHPERIKLGYSQEIPWPDTTFDVVVMSEVLEHLNPAEFASTMIEVRRVLKVNGRFIGTVPDSEDLTNSIVYCPDCQRKFHRWGHTRSFTSSQLEGELSNAQFIVRDIHVRAFPDFSRKGAINLIKSMTKLMLGRMGAKIAHPNIFFMAVKP